MNRYKSILSATLVLLLLLSGYMQYQMNADLRSGLKDLSGIHTASLAEFNDKLDSLQTELATLEQDWRLLHSGLNQLLVNVQSNPGTPESRSSTSTGTMQEPATVSDENSSAGDYREARMNVINSPEAIELMTRNNVENQYGEFIQSLNLPAGEEQNLRGLLSAAMTMGYEFMQQLQAGEISRSEFNDLNRENFRQLENELTRVLSNEDMLAYRQYQRDAPIRDRAKNEANSYVQLGINAPRLTVENRVLVAGVIAEVMAKPRNTVAMNGEQISVIYEEAEQILQETLDEDQFRIVSDYFERQGEILRLMAP